jgi:hypothetical protein
MSNTMMLVIAEITSVRIPSHYSPDSTRYLEISTDHIAKTDGHNSHDPLEQ